MSTVAEKAPVKINKRHVRQVLGEFVPGGPRTMDEHIEQAALVSWERNYAWWYACAGANRVERGFVGILSNFDTLTVEGQKSALGFIFQEMDKYLDRRCGWYEMVVIEQFETQHQDYEIV